MSRSARCSRSPWTRRNEPEPRGDRTRRARASYADAEPIPFWLGTRMHRLPASVRGSATADLAIVGGGTPACGRRSRPSRRIPRAMSCWSNATRSRSAPAGATAGFCDATLTHGLDNGLARFPDEIDRIEAVGRGELPGLAETIARHGIECDWVDQRGGRRRHRTASGRLAPRGRRARAGPRPDSVFLDRDEVRAKLNSPRSWPVSGSATIAPWSTPHAWHGG